MIRDIIQAPDPRLLAVSEPLKLLAPMPAVVGDLTDTRIKHHALGLAAVQIGVPLRIISVKPSIVGGWKTIINPEIVKRSIESATELEGCMSINGGVGRFPVRRSLTIWLKFLTVDGKEMMLIATGLAARVLQHEIDHLDGKLIRP